MPSTSHPNHVWLDDPNDIVITGYGAITPLGPSVEAMMTGLYAGRSGVRLLDPKAGIDGKAWVGAAIEGFDPKQHVQPRKTIKVMCREIQLAFGASMQACAMAGITQGSIEPDRLGTVFSGEIIFSEIADVEDIVRLCAKDGDMVHSQWSAQAIENMYPLWMLKSLPNMAACHVGIALDARGPNNTITTEGTSGLGALLEGMNVIRRNQADVIVIGSSASRVGFTRLLQRYEEDYSPSISEEGTICKPFDATRNGAAPGEVASTMVIERREHALARGAKVLGVLRGHASVFSGSSERWGGAKIATGNAIRSLMERAKVQPEQVDHINSAANGTKIMDSLQAQAIAETTGRCPVVSYKGALGDSISGSGLIELIASVEGMRQGRIAPTTNHQSTAYDCPIEVISGDAKPAQNECFIKLSNTPQGHCVGVLVSR
jgi:3-oxoacyl-[acyl-carrier-protein] synthase II